MNTSKRDKLAKELAKTLDDRNSLPVYQHFVMIYKETHLRKTLEKVMSIPKRKIKKSRGALFTFLVQQNSESRK